MVLLRNNNKTAYVWMRILPLKKRVNRDNCSFATKQCMFGVFAIGEILRYRGSHYWNGQLSCRAKCWVTDGWYHLQCHDYHTSHKSIKHIHNGTRLVWVYKLISTPLPPIPPLYNRGNCYAMMTTRASAVLKIHTSDYFKQGWEKGSLMMWSLVFLVKRRGDRCRACCCCCRGWE